MSGVRKSSRIRKSITTIDQNLEDDDEEVFVPSKSRPADRRVSNKRPSTDDNDEQQEMITPKKRQKKKAAASTATTKTSPYFDVKSTQKKVASPVKETKKPVKPRAKKKPSVDENSALSNDATSVTTKGQSNATVTSSYRASNVVATTASDKDSDDDSDDGGWEDVQAKPSEEAEIQSVSSLSTITYTHRDPSSCSKNAKRSKQH